LVDNFGSATLNIKMASSNGVDDVFKKEDMK